MSTAADSPSHLHAEYEIEPSRKEGPVKLRQLLAVYMIATIAMESTAKPTLKSCEAPVNLSVITIQKLEGAKF